LVLKHKNKLGYTNDIGKNSSGEIINRGNKISENTNVFALQRNKIFT
jgi:hypothetical protein